MSADLVAIAGRNEIRVGAELGEKVESRASADVERRVRRCLGGELTSGVAQGGLELARREPTGECAEEGGGERGVGAGEDRGSLRRDTVQRRRLAHRPRSAHALRAHHPVALERRELRAYRVVREPERLRELLDAPRTAPQQRDDASPGRAIILPLPPC